MKRKENRRLLTPVRVEHNGVTLRLWPDQKAADDASAFIGKGSPVIHVSQNGWLFKDDAGHWHDTDGVLDQNPNA